MLQTTAHRPKDRARREITRGVRFDKATAAKVAALASRLDISFSAAVLALTVDGLVHRRSCGKSEAAA